MISCRLMVPLAALALLAACAGTDNSSPMSFASAGGDAKAVAQLKPTQGSTAAGSVEFVQHGNEVTVSARLSGLKPNQEHGFHIHEKGDCSSPDAMSAGGHFNPTGSPHGPQSGPHHAGDIPNLKADGNGTAQGTFRISGVSIGSGGAGDILGKGLVVHANPDDYATQPTGNSGGRIACGVITRG
jgi:Cu-Zn family superoxide dismutase